MVLVTMYFFKTAFKTIYIGKFLYNLRIISGIKYTHTLIEYACYTILYDDVIWY